jgi:hypothetical protein
MVAFSGKSGGNEVGRRAAGVPTSGGTGVGGISGDVVPMSGGTVAEQRYGERLSMSGVLDGEKDKARRTQSSQDTQEDFLPS